MPRPKGEARGCRTVLRDDMHMRTPWWCLLDLDKDNDTDADVRSLLNGQSTLGSSSLRSLDAVV